MENENRTLGAKGKLLCIAVVLAIFTVNAFLIGPQITTLLSDVLYAESLLPIALSVLYDCIEALAVAICYALVLVALYDEERARGIFVTFGLLTAYKYIAAHLYVWMTSNGTITLRVWDIIWSLADDLWWTLLEIVLMAIVFNIMKKIMTPYHDKRLVAQRVNKKSEEKVEIEEPYPFKRIYDKSNCLLRSAYVCAVATLVAKLFGKVTTDVESIVTMGFPKQWQTWLYMILDYARIAILGLIVYFTIYLMMKIVLKKTK